MVPFLSPLWLWHHGPITCTYCMGSKVSSLSRIYLYLQLLWLSWVNTVQPSLKRNLSQKEFNWIEVMASNICSGATTMTTKTFSTSTLRIIIKTRYLAWTKFGITILHTYYNKNTIISMNYSQHNNSQHKDTQYYNKTWLTAQVAHSITTLSITTLSKMTLRSILNTRYSAWWHSA